MKKSIAVLFGGQSQEHRISLVSAATILQALSQSTDKYDIFPIAVTREGSWFLVPDWRRFLLAKPMQDHLPPPLTEAMITEQSRAIQGASSPQRIYLLPGRSSENPVNPVNPSNPGSLGSYGNPSNLESQWNPGNQGDQRKEGKMPPPIRLCSTSTALPQSVSGHLAIDLVFPVLHGPYGEDGSLQGLLQYLGLPFVGCGVLASSLCMDKAFTKHVLQTHFPVPKFLSYKQSDALALDFNFIKEELGLPFYVKPVNQGSSVGIHRVYSEKECLPAIKDALRYDTKLILEQNIIGRELECAVLGNARSLHHAKAWPDAIGAAPMTSPVGEIRVKDAFYSYQAKYEGGAGEIALDVPARISKSEQRQAQQLALEVFEFLQLEGLARVDLFLEESGTFLVNEINTMPGFTSISMYPQLWEKSGYALPVLLDKLFSLAWDT